MLTNFKKLLIFSSLKIGLVIRNLLSTSDSAYKLVLIPRLENFRWLVGRWKALYVFELAKSKVPAYKEFLESQGFTDVSLDGFNPRLESIPITDKQSYVKKYSLESRCFSGFIPDRGSVIDESSGTSGTATNWVRGPQEREAVKKLLQIGVHTMIGSQPFFAINAFALGPWATGMNVSMSIVDVAILKSVGPDVVKIENTLIDFGPKYNYVIAGYPPFLKSLVDSSKVDWSKYHIVAFFGGESMSEGMRSYLGKAFKAAYGSYGASDLEINIAIENDFTIKLRQLISTNHALADRLLLKGHSFTPMIFQYNPLDYLIESTPEHELVVTLCRASNVSPKVRYNIHDTGHVLRFPELAKIFQDLNIPLKVLGRTYDLPLLFLYGRSDMAVAFFGCKISPLEIQDIIYSNKELAIKFNAFALITYEDDQLNKKLVLALELNPGEEGLKDKDALSEQIFEKLKLSNQDYREASKMIPAGSKPKIEIHKSGTGPFEKNDIRVKLHYIQKR